MTGTPIVRQLCAADIPQAMSLKESAGWNQTEADWVRLMEMEPEGCWGVEVEGRLAATTTLVTYGGALAWIGMVLAHPESRGRGFASLLVHHALDVARLRGVSCLRLDATETGTAIYSKLGFAVECSLERWKRAPGKFSGTPPDLPDGFDASLDLAAFGVDRTHLLTRLASAESALIPSRGFAMGRPGSHAFYFGPCVCVGQTVARELLAWYVARHFDQPIYWDLFPENRGAVQLAREYGFESVRYLTRMCRRLSVQSTYPEPNNPFVYAIAGFELG